MEGSRVSSVGYKGCSDGRQLVDTDSTPASIIAGSVLLYICNEYPKFEAMLNDRNMDRLLLGVEKTIREDLEQMNISNREKRHA